MSNFIPRLIPSVSQKSLSSVPVGTLVWYFGKLSDVGSGDLTGWVVANGKTVNMASYPELKGHFLELYSGDYYCGTSITVDYYVCENTTTAHSAFVSGQTYITTSSGNTSAGYKVLDHLTKELHANVSAIVSLGTTGVTNCLEQGSRIYSMLTKSTSNAYLWTSATAKTTLPYLTNSTNTISGTTRRVFANVDKNSVRIHNGFEHPESVNDVSKIQANWNTLITATSGKNKNIRTTLESYINIPQDVEQFAGFSSTKTGLAYLYDINSKMINYYTALKNAGDTASYEKFSIQMPDLIAGSTAIATFDDNVVGTSTPGAVPNITGTFYGTNNSSGGSGTSGAFTTTSTKLFGASGHNGVTIYAASMSFDASSSSNIYKSSANGVTPAGIYAIPIIKVM